MEFAKTAPDVHGEGQLILVNGPHIASTFILKGTNSGPLMGPDGKEMPATKKKFGLMFGHAVDLDPAALKVVKEIGVQDSGTFASQLGLSKMPARPVMDKGADAPTIVIAKDDAAEAANVRRREGPARGLEQARRGRRRRLPCRRRGLSRLERAEGQQQEGELRDEQELLEGLLRREDQPVVDLGRGRLCRLDRNVRRNERRRLSGDGLKKGTGKKVSAPFLEIDRLEGGKFKEAWLFLDGGTFAAQLGLMPGK